MEETGAPMKNNVTGCLCLVITATVLYSCASQQVSPSVSIPADKGADTGRIVYNRALPVTSPTDIVIRGASDYTFDSSWFLQDLLYQDRMEIKKWKGTVTRDTETCPVEIVYRTYKRDTAIARYVFIKTPVIHSGSSFPKLTINDSYVREKDLPYPVALWTASGRQFSLFLPVLRKTLIGGQQADTLLASFIESEHQLYVLDETDKLAARLSRTGYRITDENATPGLWRDLAYYAIVREVCAGR